MLLYGLDEQGAGQSCLFVHLEGCDALVLHEKLQALGDIHWLILCFIQGLVNSG